MDFNPALPEDRQYITGYGDGAFTISNVRHTGPVIVLPDATSAWAHGKPLTESDFAIVLQASPVPEILLLGTGTAIRHPGPALLRALEARGIVLDVMDTGAACRTYNVLLSEERRVGAALIPV